MEMKTSIKWKKDYKYAAVYSENEHDFFIEPDLDDETKIQAENIFFAKELGEFSN